MGIYIIKRFLYMLVLIALTTVVSFAIIVLPPGDYLTSYVSRLEAQGGDVTNEQIEALEVEQQRLNETIARPSFYKESTTRIAEILARLEEIDKALPLVYTRWQSLESRA